MSVYWLTPVTGLSPATLGGERIMIAGENAEAFRSMMYKIHPRLLLTFKSALLVSGDGDKCGPDGGEADIHLKPPGPVVFDGSSLVLSHCGEAFLERLPDPEEAVARLHAADPALRSGLEQPPYGDWLNYAVQWWSLGYRVMLLKEE
jgi:hypothetical protein